MRRLRFARHRWRARGAPSWRETSSTIADLTAIENLSFAFPRIDASVIVPARGRFDLTAACLRSLATAAAAESSNSPGFEVVVVEDGSNDEAYGVLEGVPGLRLVRRQHPGGFVEAANDGAKAAQAGFLVFLNNDTRVTQGWLAALLGTFRDFPDAGLVGARLIDPDGTLQESGGVLWNDGTATHYGRGLHPDAPEAAYARRVDYCSGACLAVETDLFARLGGFDRRFAPGYYEDVDLALRARAIGRSTVVQTTATVYHDEGGTAGKSVRPRNRDRLLAAHDGRLDGQFDPGSDLEAAKERFRDAREPRGRVLVVDWRPPSPRRDAGSARMVALLRALVARNWKTTYLAEGATVEDDELAPLRAAGIECPAGPFERSVRGHLRRRGASYDTVVLCRPSVAERATPWVRRFAPQANLVFDTVDLRFLRESRRGEVEADGAARSRAREWQRREIGLVLEADATLVTSETERARLRRECRGAAVHVVPTVYRVRRQTPTFGKRGGVLFVGGWEHRPNVDAVHWFAGEVVPLLAESLPDITVRIVGADGEGRIPSEVAALECRNVRIEGGVDDLESVYDAVRVAVAPLRFGAGLKGKIHQALASGVPVVTTPIGAEGFPGAENVLLVSDDAPAFAAGVLSLHEDRERWERLRSAGYEVATGPLSTETALAALERALVGAEPLSGP